MCLPTEICGPHRYYQLVAGPHAALAQLLPSTLRIANAEALEQQHRKLPAAGGDDSTSEGDESSRGGEDGGRVFHRGESDVGAAAVERRRRAVASQGPPEAAGMGSAAGTNPAGSNNDGGEQFSRRTTAPPVLSQLSTHTPPNSPRALERRWTNLEISVQRREADGSAAGAMGGGSVVL